MPIPSRRDFLALSALTLTGIGLAGCSRLGGGTSTGTGESLDQPIDASRTLIAYFSHPLTDSPDNMNSDEENSTHVVDGRVYGNVQYIAQLIEASVGADVFRIETAEPLPLDFGPLEDQALKEQEDGTRPELAAMVDNLDDYDTVFIGYPIYWYDLPMPLFTFLEQQDFAGKTLIPFSVHGGSQLSGTVERIAGLLPDSTVSTNAFTISRDDMDDSEPQVRTWLDSL